MKSSPINQAFEANEIVVLNELVLVKKK